MHQLFEEILAFDRDVARREQAKTLRRQYRITKTLDGDILLKSYRSFEKIHIDIKLRIKKSSEVLPHLQGWTKVAKSL